MEKERHFPRLNLSCDIEYSIDETPDSSLAEAARSKTKDLSVGGMCFITYKELPIGTVLNLKFTLKSSDNPINVKGIIVWTEKFNIGGQQGWDNGIQFIEVPGKSKTNIIKYIDSML